VARVGLLCPDLLFGSKLQGALRAAGHEPVAAGDDADVLVVDLTDEPDARIAAAAPAVHGTLKLLDDQGIPGELVLREVRTGRVETTQMWGRPESVRQEFRRIRSQ